MVATAVASASADIVIGNGRIESERRNASAFRSISVSGSGTLRVHRGGQRIELTGDSNILPYITTTVAGDELKIGFKPFTSIMHSTKLQFDVTLPELSGLRLAGSGDAYVDAFKGEAFDGAITGSGGIKAELDYRKIALSCSGSGGFDATVKAGSLDLRCTGSGDAYIKGSSDRVDASISGSGRMGARDFRVGDARVVVSGSGLVEIKVVKTLDAAISGSGGVRYWGSPSVKERVSGSGRVSKAGE
jgi:hypothetical protein